MTPTTIIVPLDGSELAEAALGPGTALASAFAADLDLVRATWHRPPDEEEHYLAEVVDRLEGVTVHPRVVHGFAAPGITDLVDAIPGTMLCLTTRGHNGLLGELLLGSVAAELVDSARVPTVLLGPAFVRTPQLGDGAGPDLLFCFDASEAARCLESIVIDIATRLHLHVRVVTVLHRDGEYLGDVASGAVREAAGQFIDRLALRGLTGEHVVLESIDPARAILQDARESLPWLIVAGATAGRTSRGVARFSRAVLGSTSQRVVRHATVPVLVGQP